MSMETVAIGIVGTSWWVDSMYLPALANHTKAKVVAICGRDPERAHMMAHRWHIPSVYTDYNVMIEDAKLDAIIVATANDTHYPITMKSLDQGLHVLCEKPLALNAMDAQRMLELAREKGVKHMTPFTYRFMPTSRYLKALIEADYIGRPYHLNLRYYTGYARKNEYLWRLDLDKAGSGILGDIGSHFLYLADWFYGEIKTISCQLGNLVERPNTRPNGEPYPLGDDMAIMTLEFANGAYGVIHASATCYEDTPFGQTHHMEFHGSKGTLYSFTDWDTIQQVKGARVGEGMLTELPIPDHIWGSVRHDTVHNTYRDVFRKEKLMIGEFIDGIVNDQAISPSFADGLRIQQLIDAAIQSNKLGQRITVDYSSSV